MKPRGQGRTTVFIGYSHKDKEWLDRLHVHLAPIARNYDVNIWDDTKIKSGSRWKEEIDGAIQYAKIIILLVSADFLASEFITVEELPPLLEGAQKGGAHILPVILSPCRFSRHPILSQFQPANNPSEPIRSMRRDRQEGVFDKLAAEIEGILKADLSLKMSGRARKGKPTKRRTDKSLLSRQRAGSRPSEEGFTDGKQPETRSTLRKESTEDRNRRWAGGLMEMILRRWPLAVSFLVLLVAISGAVWWGEHFAHYRESQAATIAPLGANQLKVTVWKGTQARLLDNSLFIDLKETELDEGSGKYKVTALVSSPNNPPLVIKDKDASGLIIYRYPNPGRFKIRVLSSDARQAEFLVEITGS